MKVCLIQREREIEREREKLREPTGKFVSADSQLPEPPEDSQTTRLPSQKAGRGAGSVATG